MNTHNTITVDTLKALLAEENARDLLRLALHNTIASVLREKWNGKKLNRRFATQVQAALQAKNPSATVYYSTDCNTWLKIWGIEGAHPYDSRIQVFIGYDSEVTAYNPERFETTDLCHGKAAQERIDNRNRLLAEGVALSLLVAKVNAVNTAWADLKGILNEPLYADALGYQVEPFLDVKARY